MTVAEKRKSLFVTDGLYFGINIPQEAAQMSSEGKTDLDVDIYKSNNERCDFYINSNVDIVNTNPRICTIDKQPIDKELRNYDSHREDVASIIDKHIYQQTKSDEAYYFSIGYSLIGGGTVVTHTYKENHTSIRTPLQPLVSVLLIIVVIVIIFRLLSTKLTINNKPKIEQLEALASWSLVTIIESIIVAIIDIVLVVCILALVSMVS